MNINLGFVAQGTGTVDAIEATYAPVPLALMDRMMVLFRAIGMNTISNPTFNPNALGAKVITKNGGEVLAIGDITGDGFVGLLIYEEANDRWILANPGGEIYSNVITPVAFTVNQNNYNPTGLESADVLRLTSTGSNQITGLVAPSPVRAVTKRIINIGGSNITLVNSSASSTAANRFLGNGNRVLGGDEAVDIWYDVSATRWRFIFN